MSQPRLGSGDRFKKLKEKLARKGVNNPSAAAAKIGMNKFGKERMEKMAQAGKK